MAAKEREYWDVVMHFDSLTDATMFSLRPGTESPKHCKTFVCPHCGKPWPMHHRERWSPLKHDEYRQLVHAKEINYENEQRYCCDATRRDCNNGE